MRIITWNVNSLKSILPFRPWNELKNKTIEGMLDAMDAEIICFQEHKLRRDQLTKPYVLPSSNYDSFFSFPSWKQGYSGTCCYVKNTYAVPIKAEEGITGLCLDGGVSSASTSSAAVTVGSSGSGSGSGAGAVSGGQTQNWSGAPGGMRWRKEERIGGYVGEDEVLGGVLEDLDGREFDLKRLDLEGRGVVLDFGFFILFNLYCPNETNDSRLPYKLNYLHYLESRVSKLIDQGRNVIIVGDLNVCHRPIDNGEGGIQRNKEEHFDHPARKWMENWVQDGDGSEGKKHGVWDVTRMAWPERKGMFTCWNTKLDARPSNYGSRIDFVLVTKDLLPWIKHSDIQPDIMGSDHCPVFVDLHESIITPEGNTLHLKDLMNPSPRIPLPQALEVLQDPERGVPEPPGFATKWWDEYSGKQRSLKDFFGKKGEKAPVPKLMRNRSSSTKPNGGGQPGAPFDKARTSPAPVRSESVGVTGESIEQEDVSAKSKTDFGIETKAQASLSRSATGKESPAKDEACIDLTDDVPESSSMAKARLSAKSVPSAKTAGKGKLSGKVTKPSQPKLSSFFRPPPTAPTPSTSQSQTKTKNKSTTPDPSRAEMSMDLKQPSASSGPSRSQPSETEEADYLYAVQLAEEQEVEENGIGLDEEAERAAMMDQAEVVSTWGNIFAKKVTPKCRVHGMPCKAFTTKISGKNKGKKFWLCSRPVGEGYDKGRSKRPRDEVNPEFRCDFFLWDSAVKERETPVGGSGMEENGKAELMDGETSAKKRKLTN